MTVYLSKTASGQTEPFELQVARGQIPGHTVFNVFGYGVTPSSGTVAGVFYPAWENSSTPSYYVFPTSAQKMYVASTVNGDSGGYVSINGLDSNYNPISETVTLGGTAGTGVITTNTYWRINSMMIPANSPTAITGVITLQNQAATAGATEYAQINTTTLNGSTISIGVTQMSVYTVPATQTLYLGRFTAFSGYTGSSANYFTYRAVANYPSSLVAGATLTKRVVLQSPFTNEYNIQREYPFSYPSGTDIVWQLAPSAATNSLPYAVNIGGVLIGNSS